MPARRQRIERLPHHVGAQSRHRERDVLEDGVGDHEVEGAELVGDVAVRVGVVDGDVVEAVLVQPGAGDGDGFGVDVEGDDLLRPQRRATA